MILHTFRDLVGKDEEGVSGLLKLQADEHRVKSQVIEMKKQLTTCTTMLSNYVKLHGVDGEGVGGKHKTLHGSVSRLQQVALDVGLDWFLDGRWEGPPNPILSCEKFYVEVVLGGAGSVKAATMIFTERNSEETTRDEPEMKEINNDLTRMLNDDLIDEFKENLEAVNRFEKLATKVKNVSDRNLYKELRAVELELLASAKSSTFVLSHWAEIKSYVTLQVGGNKCRHSMVDLHRPSSHLSREPLRSIQAG